MAASKASLEAIWLRLLLKSCEAPQPRATTLYEDNRACQLMSESPAHRERRKHIDLGVYLLKEQVKNGVVRLFECPTTCMPADVFMKSTRDPSSSSIMKSSTATRYRLLRGHYERQLRSSPEQEPRPKNSCCCSRL